MAKRGKYIKLSKQEKEEIRRLTQKANRRISAYMKEYEKEGLSIIPYEVSGGFQTRQQWETEKYALSRKVRFTSVKEYRERMKLLRSFDSEIMRPVLTEYTEVQRYKTIKAMETSLGVNISPKMEKAIGKMTLGELTVFWNKFESEGRRLKAEYSSEAAMSATLNAFSEDIKSLYDRSLPKKKKG